MPKLDSLSATKRATPQRRAILEELQAGRSHPTADEVYERVRLRFPRISMGTVYRNLQLLARDGKIRRLEGDHSQMRFDGTLDLHQHVRCTSCGRLDDVAFRLEPDVVSRVGAESGYRVDDYAVVFEGLCPACGDRTRQRGSSIRRTESRRNQT